MFFLTFNLTTIDPDFLGLEIDALESHNHIWVTLWSTTKTKHNMGFIIYTVWESLIPCDRITHSIFKLDSAICFFCLFVFILLG